MVFLGSFFEQLEDSLVVVERKIFAHQYYNRLLVTQVTVKRKTLPEDIEGADGITNSNAILTIQFDS
jgi:hypothetical protein